MMSRLPRWMLWGGSLLALVAGMINAAGYLGMYHQALTHMTGNSTLLGLALVYGETGMLRYFALVLLSFVAGCALSGVIIGDSVLRPGRRYGVALLLESALLWLAIPLLSAGHDAGLWLAAMAAGLQNAMAATFSGAVVRTTHMSGIITDLGTFLGQWLRGTAVDSRRVLLYLALLASFVAGAMLAAAVWPRFGVFTLVVPATISALAGLGYMLWHRRRSMVG